MPGAVIIVIALLIFPTLVFIAGGIGAAIVGQMLQRDGEIRNEGSELLAIDD